MENRTYDALQFLPKSTADLISHGHDFAYRYAPKIYGAGYRREEKHPPACSMIRASGASAPCMRS